MRNPYRITFTALLLTLLGGTAAGQGIDVAKSLAAKVIDVDVDERTVTVEFEDGNVRGTYTVADNAEFYTYNGRLHVPQTFNALRVGIDVLLEFDNIEGMVTLRKVTTETQRSGG